MSTTDRILTAINDPAQRKQNRLDWMDYHLIKKWGNAGSKYANGCANCCSHWLKRAGVTLSKVHPDTLGLVNELLSKGWKREHDPAKWKPGWVVFSTDANRNGKPDHVVILTRRVNPSRWLAVDNQNYGEPYARGVKPHGPKTPLDYALVPPDEGQVQHGLTPSETQNIKRSFGVLYAYAQRLSDDERKQLNLLRHGPYFGQVK